MERRQDSFPGILTSEDSFVQQLHSRLALVQAGSSPDTSRSCSKLLKSSRFLPYQRSRSLHLLGFAPHRSTRRRLSRNCSLPLLSLGPSFPTPLKKTASDIVSIQKRKSVPRLRDHKNRTLPRRSASLRKAETLRALDDDGDELVPTVPATPQESSQSHEHLIFTPIPILSPPYGHTSRVPVSPGTTAKVRLGKYKEREGRTAHNDRQIPEPLGSDKLLSCLGSPEDWEQFLGLGKAARLEHLDWLIHFIPGEGSATSGGSFSSTSSLSSPDTSQFKKSRRNLIDQLTTSPETRFHAAWMFLRYHYILGMNRNVSAAERPLPLFSASVLWNTTSATLAISVKFHRDFLLPLLPIEAAEFMKISPHDMGFEEFEAAQRTVLDAFSYTLGVTPQPFLDQLWLALPSLRECLEFDGGWNQVKKETWRLLLSSLYAPDVIKFPVSVLTVGALSRALITVLTQHFEYQSTWNNFLNYTTVKGHSKQKMKTPQIFESVAQDVSRLVVSDIKTGGGVSDMEFEECWEWLHLVIAST